MKFKKTLFLLLGNLLLFSCSSNSTIDDWRDVKRNDMKETLLDIKNENNKVHEIDYEDLNISKLLVVPPPPPIGNGELISFSITEDVSLKDVFIELGRLADIDIQIDPKINTGIILKVTNKPINIVIDKICELANLKYEYNDGVLKIVRDLPYSVNYDVDILIEHDLWDSIEKSIEYLLEIFPVKKQKPIISSDLDTGFVNNTANNEDSEENFEQKISINKAAGIISIYANSKAQYAISNFIKQAKKNYASQVLIEAKVVEVKLNDKYQAGINWNLNSIATDTTGNTTGSTGGGTNDDPKDTTTNYLSVINASGSTGGLTNLLLKKKIGSKNLNVVIDAMQEFGDTKTISSPRISTLNNQKALLDFINTLVYFSVEKDEDGEDKEGNTKYTYTSTKQEEEVGVKLAITPTINLDKQEITLSVKPELSSLIGYVNDPVNEGNKVPQIQKRTLETSLKIKSGDIMVIGGLMSESITNSDRGIPILMNIPVLGYLFKFKSNEKSLTETVIFIKATIINPGDSMNKKDRRILNNFVEQNTSGEN